MTRLGKISPRRVRLASGLALEIVDTGERDAVPVVLLHGILDSWRAFELVLPELPESVRAIAVSQRGHGASDKPASAYSMHDLAGDVAALLDELALPDAVVVGHSMGSIVARRFAADHPGRTRRLVLAGAFARLRGRPDLERFAATVATLTDPLDAGFLRELQASSVAADVPSSFINAMVTESHKVPVRVLQAVFAAMFADDACDSSDRISAPTLIVWGDRDPSCRHSDQEQLLGAIPDARLSVYGGVAHKPHWEQPIRFAQELSSFVVAQDNR